MGLLTEVPLTQIKSRGAITADDVLNIRRNYYADSGVAPDEVDALFELNQACPSQDPSWPDAFVEMITDYVVHQMVPHGYVDTQNAAWLIERISKDGKVASCTELELLVNVLDKAEMAPESLIRFALEQVKQAVISGEGPLRSGKSLDRGVVSEADVELLRRILYAVGGDGNIAISRAEADVLFDINDATADANNHPAWTELFVKAIANCVMTVSGYQVPPRETALARERWLEQRGDLAPGAFYGNILAKLFGSSPKRSAEDAAIDRLAQQRIEIAIGEAVTVLEASWLAQRIGKDGKLTPNERALFDFLRKESPSIDPALQRLIDKLAA